MELMGAEVARDEDYQRRGGFLSLHTTHVHAAHPDMRTHTYTHYSHRFPWLLHSHFLPWSNLCVKTSLKLKFSEFRWTILTWTTCSRVISFTTAHHPLCVLVNLPSIYFCPLNPQKDDRNASDSRPLTQHVSRTRNQHLCNAQLERCMGP